jgi:hypothetical protein
MSGTRTIFHTATIAHQVPGPPADMSAVAYDLQYIRPLVAQLVEQNPAASRDTHLVGLHDHYPCISCATHFLELTVQRG